MMEKAALHLPPTHLIRFECVTGGKNILPKYRECSAIGWNGAVNVLHVICFVEMLYETCVPRHRKPTRWRRREKKNRICKWIQKLIRTVFWYVILHHTYTNQIKNVPSWMLAEKKKKLFQHVVCFNNTQMASDANWKWWNLFAWAGLDLRAIKLCLNIKGGAFSSWNWKIRIIVTLLVSFRYVGDCHLHKKKRSYCHSYWYDEMMPI